MFLECGGGGGCKKKMFFVAVSKNIFSSKMEPVWEWFLSLGAGGGGGGWGGPKRQKKIFRCGLKKIVLVKNRAILADFGSSAWGS